MVRIWTVFFDLLIEIDRYYIKKDQFILKKINFLSKSDENRDRRFRLVVGFRIGPKSTIEIGRLGIRIIDDSICKPLSH